ncbi:MAG: divalent metal cation transporter [Opitutales bacterium]
MSIEQEKKYLRDAESKGLYSCLAAYTKLSGPGWLQSAITLGGGSLASSLFLGVLAGYSLLWLQPIAIILGIIMLCAISHVTLSTGQSPFVSINSEINPVLGWGWAIATIMANIVWCLPQFTLGTAAVTQNLVPSLNHTGGKVLVVLVLVLTAGLVIWAYDRGNRGVKIFDLILKIMVGLVVLSFFGVVIKMGTAGDLPWNEIAAGFIPDFSLFSQPAEVYTPFLEGTGEFRSFWENKIISLQKDVMIAAAATAVGINMTFFMPFVLLNRKWGREHRGLAKFDLWTALLIPYVVATSCVVIAAGSQFNGKPESAYQDYENRVLHSNLAKGYGDFMTERLSLELGKEEFNKLAPIQKKERMRSIPEPDKQLAAMLVKRDAFNLAASLESLLENKTFSHYIFGIGVVGMALSTIIILMTINGHAICEVLGKPHKGPVFLGGAYIAGIGVLGPFVWSDAAFWLAVPTSILGFTLIPVAYLSFFLLLNSKNVLGRERPSGMGRIIWNTGLILSLAIMGTAAFYVAWNKTWGDIPFGRFALVGFGILLLIGHFTLKNKKLERKVSAIELKFQQLKKSSESNSN